MQAELKEETLCDAWHLFDGSAQQRSRCRLTHCTAPTNMLSLCFLQSRSLQHRILILLVLVICISQFSYMHGAKGDTSGSANSATTPSSKQNWLVWRTMEQP